MQLTPAQRHTALVREGFNFTNDEHTNTNGFQRRYSKDASIQWAFFVLVEETLAA